MDPITAAALTAISSTSGGGILAVVFLIVLATIPIVIKFWNWSKETSAQGILYQQLSEMVQRQRAELDEMYSQRVEQQEQIFELRSKVDKLEGCESVVEILKQKLDQKDQVIAERDAKIASLLEELLKMKDRVHNLELRLRADEERFINN